MKTKLPFETEIHVRSEGTLRLAAIDEIVGGNSYDDWDDWIADRVRHHLDLRNWLFWAER